MLSAIKYWIRKDEFQIKPMKLNVIIALRNDELPNKFPMFFHDIKFEAWEFDSLKFEG
jgi:hypothetical protein